MAPSPGTPKRRPRVPGRCPILVHDNPPRGKFGAAAWFACLAISFALVLIFRAGLSHQTWVTNLAKEGSPAPALSAHSPTGYELGQRHFLGTHQRGETYRWIAEVQEAFAAGPWASPV